MDRVLGCVAFLSAQVAHVLRVNEEHLELNGLELDLIYFLAGQRYIYGVWWGS